MIKNFIVFAVTYLGIVVLLALFVEPDQDWITGLFMFANLFITTCVLLIYNKIFNEDILSLLGAFYITAIGASVVKIITTALFDRMYSPSLMLLTLVSFIILKREYDDMKERD